MLQQVLLPEGVAINLSFKQVRWLDEPYLKEALIGRKGDDAPTIRPGLHAYDGSYTGLEIVWQDLAATVQTAHAGDDLVVLLSPSRMPEMPVKLVIELGMLWNRPGALEKLGEHGLRAVTPDRTIAVFTTGMHQEDYYVQTMGPYLVVPIEGPIALSTGRMRTLEEVEEAVAAARAALEDEAADPRGPAARPGSPSSRASPGTWSTSREATGSSPPWVACGTRSTAATASSVGTTSSSPT